MRTAAELTVRRGADPARAGAHSCEPPRPSSVTREQLAHVLRAASRIAEVRDVVVIGSQSVLGTFADGQEPRTSDPERARLSAPVRPPDISAAGVSSRERPVLPSPRRS